jgi:hypothetical protein
MIGYLKVIIVEKKLAAILKVMMNLMKVGNI